MHDGAEEAKRSTNILDILSKYGIRTEKAGRQFKACCPFHDDSTPSLSVDPVKNVWHCFGCDKGGSVIDFVMHKENIDFKEAVSRLLVDGKQVKRGSTLAAPADKTALAAPATVKSAGIDPKLITDVVEFYRNTLAGPDTKGLDYLKGRRLDDPETLKTFQAGYCNGSMKEVLPASAVEPLRKLGILNEKGNEFFSGCVVVPVFLPDGTLGEMYGRSTEGNRHLYLPGTHRGILNAKAAEVFDGIILTEALLDALSLYSIGIQNVIPCYGTGGYTADHAEALRKTRRVFLAFDNDQAGEDAAKRLADRLTADGRECHRLHLPTLDGLVKDLNDYVRHLRGQGMTVEQVKAAFLELLKHAPRVGVRRSIENKPARLTLADSGNPDNLVFTNCEVTYRLRGLFENPGNSLRVILTASREDHAHTDRFDLYTAKGRTGFAYRAANRLELPPPKIEEDLGVLIPLLETLLAEGRDKADAPKTAPPMSEGERDEALRLLRSKDLLKKLAADLETVGFVGEDRNKQLAYLIATSRKLDKPLSAIIRSESGAGKSFLMECVAELMPPEDVKYFSRLTPQSLYYMGKDELVHKLLIVDERDGSEESEYPIRTLQTRRILTLAVPMKDAATGRIKTVMLEINGPIAYMESSTQSMINPENLNRCFEIFLDESEAQTQRIYALQKQAHTPEGWKEDAHRAATVRRHRNAQRLLAPVRVAIPYTKQLRFPASWTRGRRDHQRLLHLIEAVAFLHQAQRERKRTADGEEYIEATVDDYAQTYELARIAFAQAMTDIPRNARLVLSHIRSMVKDAADRLNMSEREYGFRRRDVREYAKLPDHQVKRAMRTLEELEYITVKRGGRGGSFMYRLAADPREKDPLEGLTTPDELRESLPQP